jgi:5-formyltetrahydrofolate cyclo-ligase
MFKAAPPLNRAALRRQLRQQRRQLSPFQQKIASQKIVLRLRQLAIFKRAKHIGFYQAADGELNPLPLLKLALKHQKHCYLPVLRRFPNHELGFVRVTTHSRLHKHRFGFKQPQQKPRLWIHKLDVVCMPLVGFDNYGHRLGMGGGFYDRSLARKKYHRPFKLGLAHDCQRLDYIEPAPWDMTLDAILTPSMSLFM